MKGDLCINPELPPVKKKQNLLGVLLLILYVFDSKEDILACWIYQYSSSLKKKSSLLG